MKKGGHDVAEASIRDRRRRSFEQLAWFFEHADHVGHLRQLRRRAETGRRQDRRRPDRLRPADRGAPGGAGTSGAGSARHRRGRGRSAKGARPRRRRRRRRGRRPKPAPPAPRPRPPSDRTGPRSAVPAGWKTYQNARFGCSVRYPGDLLRPLPEADDGDGRHVQALHGHADVMLGELPRQHALASLAHQAAQGCVGGRRRATGWSATRLPALHGASCLGPAARCATPRRCAART